MAERPGFYVSFEWRKSIERLSDEEKGKLFHAMFDYAEFGVVPEFSEPILPFLWDFIQPKLDHDQQRYADTVTQNRRNRLARGWQEYAEANGINSNDMGAKNNWIDQKLETLDNNRVRPLTTVNDCNQPQPQPQLQPSKNINLSQNSEKTQKEDKGGAEGEKGAAHPNFTPMPEDEFEKLRDERLQMLESLIN